MERQQERENDLESEIKRMKNLISSLPVVVQKKVVTYETKKEEEKQFQIVPFSLTYERADLKELKKMKERSFFFNNQSFFIQQRYDESLSSFSLLSPSFGAAVYAYVANEERNKD